MWKWCRKYLVFAVAALTALGMTVVYFRRTEPAGNNEALVIGLQSGYPPFEFMDSNGRIAGFDVDLAKVVAEKLNRRLVIKDMEFDGMILSLKQGKIDLIMSGMNITPSRLEEILMVPYHGEAPAHFSLIFWRKIPEGIQKLEDIASYPNGSVSVESGAIPEVFMKRYPSICVKPFQGALAPLIDVKYGKSTANLVEEDVAKYLQGRHPEIAIMKVPVPPEEKILGFGVGIKKNNQELFHQVTAIVQEMKESGELKKLEGRWFKESGYE